MSANLYEIAERTHPRTGERYWVVRDWSQEGKVISMRFKSLDRAERCKNALMWDDNRN